VFYNYVAKPTETRARLNDIRQKASQNKLYDPFTQKVTPEILKKILNFKFEEDQAWDPLYQLQNVYSNHEIMDLLNSVSKNNIDNNLSIPYAAFGGQMMRSGGSKNPTKYFTEYPMARNGLQVQPTRQDSLDVMNSQIALNKFYDNEVKNGRLIKDVNGVSNSFYPYEGLNDQNLDFYRKQIKTREENKKKGFTQTGILDDEYKNIFNLNPSDVSRLEYQGLGKTKSSNTYKKYYRDLITPMQNLAAPFALMDIRINPQRTIDYIGKKPNYPGGAVSVLDYDPIVVKPADLKTKADWDM
jgi:hypothetical protein